MTGDLWMTWIKTCAGTTRIARLISWSTTALCVLKLTFSSRLRRSLSNQTPNLHTALWSGNNSCYEKGKNPWSDWRCKRHWWRHGQWLKHSNVSNRCDEEAQHFEGHACTCWAWSGKKWLQLHHAGFMSSQVAIGDRNEDLSPPLMSWTSGLTLTKTLQSGKTMR